MTPQDVEKIVEEQLADPGFTGPHGAADIRAALVTPFLQNYILADTYAQMSSAARSVVSYWVVAHGKFYDVFYDPAAQEFGLADFPSGGGVPQTSSVRGDLVSTFRAM